MADTQTHQSLSEAVRSVVSSSPVSEAPTVISSVPDDERAQQLLTPAQQLAMRDEVKKSLAGIADKSRSVLASSHAQLTNSLFKIYLAHRNLTILWRII